MCAQEVAALPQRPQALYLFDSAYLLTSTKGDFTMQYLTEQDPLTCIQESSDIVRILPTPLLRPFLEGLKEIEEIIPPDLMGDVNQKSLSHLKLKLAGLPDRRITEEMLAAVIGPFMQEVEEVHTTIVKKIWRAVILPCGATLITVGLLVLLGWALKWGNCMQ